MDLYLWTILGAGRIAQILRRGWEHKIEKWEGRESGDSPETNLNQLKDDRWEKKRTILHLLECCVSRDCLSVRLFSCFLHGLIDMVRR